MASKPKRLLKPSTTMKRWEKLCAECTAVYQKEMKKPKKNRLKKNLKRTPGNRIAKETAALAGMKSIGEVRCAADLDKRGIKWKYEAETLSYQHEPQSYTPDFLLYADDNKLVEYKGKMTGDTRKKILAIKRCNPDRKLYLVFEQPNNKLSSRPNSQRYWQWAEKHGIEWGDRYVRDEWFNTNNKGSNKRSKKRN